VQSIPKLPKGTAMTTRTEIVELMKDLPLDETWVPQFMARLKEKAPALYDGVLLLAAKKLNEIEENK
jgi:TorA maturation chaperone TorD